jgi:hypothetical protein
MGKETSLVCLDENVRQKGVYRQWREYPSFLVQHFVRCEIMDQTFNLGRNEGGDWREKDLSVIIGVARNTISLFI